MNRLDRSVVGLGVGAAVSPLLGLADRTPLRLIAFGTGSVLVTLILAAVAVAGGYLALRPLVVLAGAGFGIAAILLVVQLSVGGTNTLSGDGSTAGLFLGFAVGLLAVGLVRVPISTTERAY
jgi:hypothetical protein